MVADGNADTSSDDDSSGSFARGAVGSGSDEYRFSGRVESITDYESFQLDIERPRYAEDPREQVVTITGMGSGPDEGADYEFVFTGGLEAYETTSEDSVSGRTVSGTVVDGTDVYGYSGCLVSVNIKDR